MSTVKVTSAQARTLAAFRRSAYAADIREVLENNILHLRELYENTVPANESLRIDLLSAKKVTDLLFEAELEKDNG